MEIAPLIHSRTGECDYNSKFAVRPKNFSDELITWTRKRILTATRNIDMFNGVRRLVVAKNEFCIAGVVCTMKYFVNNCLEGREDAQNYVNVKGRLYGVFIGYVFKREGGKIPVINDSDLWKFFKTYLVPEWNKKSAQTVEVDYFPWDKVENAITNGAQPTAEVSNAQLYNDTFDDKELFREFLSKAVTSRDEIAFCSNVERIQPVQEGIYTAVTTSARNIASLKSLSEAKENKSREEAPRPQNNQMQEKKTKPTTKQSILTNRSSRSSILDLIMSILRKIFSFWK